MFRLYAIIWCNMLDYGMISYNKTTERRCCPRVGALPYKRVISHMRYEYHANVNIINVSNINSLMNTIVIIIVIMIITITIM